MFTVLIVLHVLLAAGLIAIVLVQRGPGATMGAAFGSGASGTVFGSRGASNFLTRTTAWLAVGFFGISLAMAVLAAGGAGNPAADMGVVGAAERQATEAGAGSEAAVDAALDAAMSELDAAPVETEAVEAASSEDGSVGADVDAEPESIPEPPVD